MVKSARQLAFDVLMKIEKDKAFSNLALDSAVKAYCQNSTDCAFVSHLVYGVVERKITLDYVISKYLDKPITKLKADALNILRLGAYQLLYSDKIPQSAAVNESVKLAKQNKLSYASGMINAVLRKITRSDLDFSNITDEAERISVVCSAPVELVKFLVFHYGAENAEKFLLSALEPKQIFIKVNTTYTSVNDFLKNLSAEGRNMD